MSDHSIPPLIPEGGGSETPPKKQTGNKSSDPQHNEAGATNKNVRNKTEAILYSALAFASSECFAVYFWEIADGVSGNCIVFFHWVSLCCLVSGIFAAAHQIIEDKKKRWRLWFWFIIPCILNLFVADIVWSPKSPILANANDQIIGTKNVGWLPPELPPDCTNITVYFGTLRFDEPRWMAEIEHDESTAKFNSTNFFTEKIQPGLELKVYDTPDDTNDSGTRYAIKDLPYSFKNDLKKLPDNSRRNRHITLTSQSMKVYGGGVTNENPVWPFVSSDHRLFVDVMIPFINERHRILMDSNIDMAITNLPKKWDDNYDSNAFEIVNEDTNPVLQVIYKSPSEVQVNGIYIVDTYSIYEAFDGAPTTITAQAIFGTSKTTQQFIMPLKDFTKMFANIAVNMNTNAIFREKFPNQKPIFKYPSSDFLGELADPVPEKSNSEMALKVAYGILWAGILWMCFGWIFFQKRSNVEPP